MTPAEAGARLIRAGGAEAEARQWRIAAADAEQLARACDLRTAAPSPPDVAARLYYCEANTYRIRRRALAKLADHWGETSSPTGRVE